MASSISNAQANATAQNQNNASNPQKFLESVLPGATNLTTSATGVIQNLLNGLPSASQARTNNAYWGVGAGAPAGGPNGAGDVGTFIGNRGADLYGQQANQNQQTGLSDLLQTIGSYTSPALANQGQQMQNSQFGANLAQQGSEFQQNYELQKFQAMLQAIGLGHQIAGNVQGNIPTPQL